MNFIYYYEIIHDICWENINHYHICLLFILNIMILYDCSTKKYCDIMNKQQTPTNNNDDRIL